MTGRHLSAKTGEQLPTHMKPVVTGDPETQHLRRNRSELRKLGRYASQGKGHARRRKAEPHPLRFDAALHAKQWKLYAKLRRALREIPGGESLDEA